MKKIILSAALVLLTSAAWAQEIEEKQEVKGEISTSLSALRLATDLVRYGYAQQSALSLAEALQIINENPTQPLKATPEGEKADTSSSEGKSGSVSLDYDKILADAKALAEGDETITKLLTQIEENGKVSHRGAVNGPSKTYEVVNGNCVHTYQISFTANYVAEIAVSGDGDTDLDLYVYDSLGNLIVCDTSYSDDCYVRWVPRWTGRFVVKVVNRGPLYNRYVLLTN